MSPRGYFVAFEGGEGAGKSTQESLLAGALVDRGYSVVRTREPGGTPAGEAIRDVVLSPRFEGLDARAEALLYAAARGEHVARVIRPALDRGDVVVCDRYLDSSVAYQGAGRVLDPDEVRDLSLWATEGLLPHLTVLLDLDPAVGRERLDASRTRYDRLEAEEADFHERVRSAYLVLAAAEPQRFLVLDATRPVDELQASIRDRVSALLD
jgi:dTMP kinase